MTKDEFNSMEVLDQIDYINKSLEEGNTLTNTCNDIGVGRSTIRDRFKKVDYTYSKEKNKYIYNVRNTDEIKPIKLSKVKKDISIKDVKQKLDNVSNMDVSLINDKVVQSNLINLSNEFNTLIEMIELYKRNSNILSNQIVIDLDTMENTLTTLRVNTDVLQMFNEFVEANRQFKKVDLVSMALKEYVLNHR